MNTTFVSVFTKWSERGKNKQRTEKYKGCRKTKGDTQKENIRDDYVNKIQEDATVCRYLFTAELLYMFRVSIAPIIRST